ncbi:uncharacterized protein B0H64DRAFT_408502 [Chaetomium fimeti]|uniref:Uncharacterized protein n=1 Tax=Chaetomium fimeti TaxID=1854472 RepID=A0AAE0LNG5_9PEZI|nr:hypothetical protein B0H64DRAFT_408502 [Chaetomium fimeti]
MQNKSAPLNFCNRDCRWPLFISCPCQACGLGTETATFLELQGIQGRPGKRETRGSQQAVGIETGIRRRAERLNIDARRYHFGHGLRHHKRSKARPSQITKPALCDRTPQPTGGCCKCSGVVLSMQADAHDGSGTTHPPPTPSHLGIESHTYQVVSTVSTTNPRPVLCAGSWPVAWPGKAGRPREGFADEMRCREGEGLEAGLVGGNGFAIRVAWSADETRLDQICCDGFCGRPGRRAW